MAAAVFRGAKILSTGNSLRCAMKRAHGVLRLLLDKALERKEITLSQWAVLSCLQDGVARTAADLARCLSHDSGMLTRLIDQLEKRELVKRHQNAADRRVHELVLTPRGQAVLKALTPAVAKIYSEVLFDFSRAEIETLQRLLQKIMAGAESLNAHNADRRAEP